MAVTEKSQQQRGNGPKSKPRYFQEGEKPRPRPSGRKPKARYWQGVEKPKVDPKSRENLPQPCNPPPRETCEACGHPDHQTAQCPNLPCDKCRAIHREDEECGHPKTRFRPGPADVSSEVSCGVCLERGHLDCSTPPVVAAKRVSEGLPASLCAFQGDDIVWSTQIVLPVVCSNCGKKKHTAAECSRGSWRPTQKSMARKQKWMDKQEEKQEMRKEAQRRKWKERNGEDEGEGGGDIDGDEGWDIDDSGVTGLGDEVEVGGEEEEEPPLKKRKKEVVLHSTTTRKRVSGKPSIKPTFARRSKMKTKAKAHSA